jgi:uncharacterized OB-fold protein
MTTSLLDQGFPVLPQLTDRNRPFWQGGQDGKLLFWRCQDCGYWIHPPIPICPIDHSKNLAPEPVSGRATLASFTVNHQRWLPGVEPPYVSGLVELPEQKALRLTTNLVHIEPDEVRIGMDLEVVFAHRPDPNGDIWLPFFQPVR